MKYHQTDQETGKIPAAIASFGIIKLGWDAIHWFGAIVWGVMATNIHRAV